MTALIGVGRKSYANEAVKEHVERRETPRESAGTWLRGTLSIPPFLTLRAFICINTCSYAPHFFHLVRPGAQIQDLRPTWDAAIQQPSSTDAADLQMKITTARIPIFLITLIMQIIHPRKKNRTTPNKAVRILINKSSIVMQMNFKMQIHYYIYGTKSKT